MRLDLANLIKKKRKYRKENLLFLENYHVNEDLLRFNQSLSIAELVEYHFICNLIMLNIIANNI